MQKNICAETRRHPAVHEKAPFTWHSWWWSFQYLKSWPVLVIYTSLYQRTIHLKPSQGFLHFIQTWSPVGIFSKKGLSDFPRLSIYHNNKFEWPVVNSLPLLAVSFQGKTDQLERRGWKEGREKSYCGRTDVFLSPLDSFFITSLNFKAFWHAACGRFSWESREAMRVNGAINLRLSTLESDMDTRDMHI